MILTDRIATAFAALWAVPSAIITFAQTGVPIGNLIGLWVIPPLAVWLILRLLRFVATGQLLALGLLLILMSACAPGRQIPAGQIAYDTQENYDRLRRVLEPVAIANADLCRDSTIGVMRATPNDVEMCALSIGMSKSGALNAWTDGTNIIITRPMLAFLVADDELAFILCHELAHVLRDHVQKTKVGLLLGAFLDGAARGQGVPTSGGFQFLGSRIGSKDREREADKIGAYLMARAGFDPRAGAWLWDRMPPGEGGWLASHPLSAERNTDLLEIAAEIRTKQRRGEPLTP